MSWARPPSLYAFITAVLALSWQALTVHFNYGGNWTALYYTGSAFKAPPAGLASEHIYLFPNSFGYDGQIYHYIAHDPMITRGFDVAMDEPRFRYRRILVPLCAWVLAGGQDRFVDAAYIFVVLLFVFLGTWWVALIAVQWTAHPAWSLAFLFLPAVATSLDRLTVDVALVAVTAGVVFYAHRPNWIGVFVLCAMAGMIRESGALLPAGVVAWCVIQRQFRRGLLLALSAIPMVAWYSYVNSRTPPVQLDIFSPIPFAGILRRLVTPFPYGFTPVVNIAATILDYAALSGIIVAVLYCIVYARQLARAPEGFVAFAFVALAAVVSIPAVWIEAYAFARGYSPLILLVALDGFRRRSLIATLPLALAAPRVGLQISPQILNVARNVFGL